MRTAISSGFWFAVLVGTIGAGAAHAQAPFADYEVRFDSTWSSQTHPTDFPGGSHYSALVGGLHDGSVVFWEPGGLASHGIEVMAETGNPFPLESEIEAAIDLGQADQSFIGGGIGSSPGSVAIEFTASQEFSLLTLVTMVAPSPDWFVGVHGFELFDGASWLQSEVVEVFAYDAGTDSGTTYNSPNADTDPQEAIALLDYPLTPGEPMGTFTITRLPEPAMQTGLLCGLALLRSLRRR